MTSRCFNPTCGTPFRYFRSGKIFAISSASRKNETGDTEYFWLCGACATAYNISVSADGAVMLEASDPGRVAPNKAYIPIST
jgi:hypothetical protein